MDRSGQGRSSVPHRRTTPVRRAPRYRERAERRVDRRDRDDRAPAGACLASAAGVRGPRAASRRSATPRRVDPSRPRTPLRSGALHRRPTRLGGARRGQPLRAARRRGRASEPAHSAGGLVRRRLVRTWPRTAPARPERARGVLVRGGMRLQPDNWTYRRQAWTLAGADRERFYSTDWLTEVKRLGAETYYPPLEL